jgi:hypothetical protein
MRDDSTPGYMVITGMVIHDAVYVATEKQERRTFYAA